MPRNLPSPMLTSIGQNALSPCILLDLTLASGVENAWSGIGSVIVDGTTYKGVGSLGAIGEISEGCEVKANGTTVALSGIDSTLLNDCLLDIKLGAPAKIWLGTFAAGVITARYPMFVGTVDKPLIPISPKDLTIRLNLETRMSNMQRATNRRYTSADQMYYFPDDSGFSWVETLNDIALQWG